MRDDIRFLQELEADLETVTRTRGAGPDRSERRRAIGRGIWAGAAAAVLAASFALGSFIQGTGRVPIDASSEVGVAGGSAPMPSPAGDTTIRRGALDAPVPQTVDVGYSGAAVGQTAAGSDQGSSGTGVKGADQTTAGTTDLSKIVRDGEMAVTIDSGSFKEKAAGVVSIAHANGGSVLSSTTANGTSGTFTLRIPAAQFDKAMVQLSQLGAVDSSAVHGQDVTAQYIDQRAHLKIYLTHRAFLYGLLAKATTSGEALALENQLQQVQLKIDQITGQLRYLDNQVAESTIKVDLHELGAAALTTTPAVENPSLGEAFSRAVQGFLNVLYVMLIGFGYLVPLLAIAVIAFAVVRLAGRRRARIA